MAPCDGQVRWCRDYGGAQPLLRHWCLRRVGSVHPPRRVRNETPEPGLRVPLIRRLQFHIHTMTGVQGSDWAEQSSIDSPRCTSTPSSTTMDDHHAWYKHPIAISLNALTNFPLSIALPSASVPEIALFPHQSSDRRHTVKYLRPLHDVGVFGRTVRLAAHRARRVGRVATAPVPPAHREHPERDGRVVQVTTTRAGRALAALPVLQRPVAAVAAAAVAAATAAAGRAAAEHAHELLPEVAAAQAVDEEVDGRVEAHEPVADVRHVRPVHPQVTQTLEALVQRPEEMRHERRGVTGDAHEDDAQNDDRHASLRRRNRRV